MPIWAYVELISFGDLKDIIRFYSEHTEWSLPIDTQSLDRVRQLRNACAHGNAIINDLNHYKKSKYKSIAPRFITNYVKSAGISKTTMDKKLSNPRINQIVHLLYAYDLIVTSTNTRNQRIEALKNLFDNRMLQHGDFFTDNPVLLSTYHFFKSIISKIQ